MDLVEVFEQKGVPPSIALETMIELKEFVEELIVPLQEDVERLEQLEEE